MYAPKLRGIQQQCKEAIHESKVLHTMQLLNKGTCVYKQHSKFFARPC